MTKSEKIRLFYGIFLSVLTAVVGILCIVQLANMYYSNGAAQGVYTLDNIKHYMLVPFIFICIWAAAAIAGYVLSVVFPTKAKRSPYVDNQKILGMLKKRLPTKGKAEGFDEARKQIDKQEMLRKIVWAVACAVMLAGAIFILVYAFNPNNYTSSGALNEDGKIYGASFWRGDILALVRATIIWLALGLVFAIGATVFDAILTKHEVALAKIAIATGDKDSVKQKNEAKKNFVIFATIAAGALTLGAIVLFIIAPSVLTALIAPTTNPAEGAKPADVPVILLIVLGILFTVLVVAGLVLMKFVKKYVPEKADKIILLCSRVAVGVVAVAFIVADLAGGASGAHDVLIKAINICTECIGLG